MTLLLAASLPLLAGLLPVHEDKAPWPQWKGPHRDGISRETAWSATGKDKPLWTTNVGLGYSSFSVGGGRLFTMGYDKDAGLDIVWCFDPQSGEEIWTHTYTAEIWNQAHTGGTLTTPSIDGDVVYTLNREGNLYCLNAADGEVLWHNALRETYEVTPPTWGFSGSPLVLDDMLIVNVGRVIAFDKETQEELWVSDDFGHAYSTPTDFALDGRALLAVFNSKGLAILDRKSGETLGEKTWTTKYDINAASPIVLDGNKLFISSAQGSGCALVQFTGSKLETLWESKVMGNKMSGSILLDGYLYGYDEAVLKCIDLEGNEKWAERGIGTGALMAADGKLILTSDAGELIVAEATPAAYKELSRTKAIEEGVFWAKPVLVDGLVYFRGSLGDVACLDHRATTKN